MRDDEQEEPAEPTTEYDAGAGVAAASPKSEEHVGYKRPPRHSRFAPGRSGNPRGRPRGVKSLSDIVRKVVGQKMTVTENGRSRSVPRLEAILLRTASHALRGDAQALRLLLQLTERYAENAQAAAQRESIAAEDLAILRRYLPGFDEPAPSGSDAKSQKDVDHER